MSIVAKAVSRSGVYFELKSDLDQPVKPQTKVSMDTVLYRGHDYNYYSYYYNRAGIQQGVGVFFAFLGVGFEVTGYIVARKADLNSSSYNLGRGLTWMGALCEIVGIPLWISGGVRKANNRRALEEIDNITRLSIGITPNGVGLVLAF